MGKNKIVLVGAGGHCKSSIEIIESLGSYEIEGIIDKISSDKKILSYPVLGDDSSIPGLIKQSCHFLITVGQIKSSFVRKTLFEDIKRNNGILATIKSPSAIISKRCVFGEGSIVFNLAIINCDVSIGKNIIINNKALIEHDSIIGDHSHISTGAIINGNCTIGNEVFIGSNSVVAQGINIVSNTIVGAGSVVIKNINEPGVYAGNPAKKIAKIEQ
ncbi:MAG: acetyltransferase [Chitinophagaceae bacterium]|nr:acetyltransferase [Chitinophagaceae bacterium]